MPLNHLIELCAFNGDIIKITGYICQDDISDEASQLRLEPPELSPRSMQGSCSPIMDGEDAEAKLLNETIEKNNGKLLAIYETLKPQVKA